MTRAAQLRRALREREATILDLSNRLLDKEAGWVDNQAIDTGIPDDRDSLVARIEALEAELQEVHHAHS